jgi:hypothetical protein
MIGPASQFTGKYGLRLGAHAHPLQRYLEELYCTW